VEGAVHIVSSVGELKGSPTSEQSMREHAAAVKTVVFWVCAAVAFGIFIGFKDGTGKASEFFAGGRSYLVSGAQIEDCCQRQHFHIIFSWFTSSKANVIVEDGSYRCCALDKRNKRTPGYQNPTEHNMTTWKKSHVVNLIIMKVQMVMQ